MSVYRNLTFPFLTIRPYFFSNFVTTIDGRAFIKNNSTYNQIGSTLDFETFLDLRKYADALVHGKHTAATHRTIDTIAQKPFLAKRKKQKKEIILPYFIVSNHPDASLLPALTQNTMQKPFLVTSVQAKVPKNILQLTSVLRIGQKIVDIQKFSKYLYSHGYNHVLLEGGPTLMGSFLSENLIDEMFQTIAPKLYSGKNNEFLTMTEGKLLEPQKLPKWELLSVKKVENELFLRYRRS